MRESCDNRRPVISIVGRKEIRGVERHIFFGTGFCDMRFTSSSLGVAPPMTSFASLSVVNEIMQNAENALSSASKQDFRARFSSVLCTADKLPDDYLYVRQFLPNGQV